MVDINKTPYERSGVQRMIGSEGTLRLNEKPIQGLDHKNLRATTAKYPEDCRTHRYELLD